MLYTAAAATQSHADGQQQDDTSPVPELIGQPGVRPGQIVAQARRPDTGDMTEMGRARQTEPVAES
jgi:hypothetical protein